MEKNSATETRKKQHISICLEKSIESDIKTGFNDLFFVHKALPEVDMSDIDTACSFLGKKITAPILIEAITGGTKEAEKINKNLAAAAEELGLAMGVGSQRAAITDKKLQETYNIRPVAPTIPLIGNLGAVQFSKGEYTIKDAKEVIKQINADALAIHLNALQEAAQPEGDLDFKNALDSIKKICADLGKPVIVKETGAGISREIALMLEKSGVAVIDVAGLGGTSFSLVESYRDKDKPAIGNTFKNWGIPTAVSVAETRKTTKLPIIASGGIRTGTDAAKAICLGADYAGLALPLLEAATKSKNDVKKVLERIIKELKTTMFLIGAKNIDELKKKDIVITGKTREWLLERGIDTKEYANRETLESLRTTVKTAMYH